MWWLLRSSVWVSVVLSTGHLFVTDVKSDKSSSSTSESSGRIRGTIGVNRLCLTLLLRALERDPRLTVKPSMLSCFNDDDDEHWDSLSLCMGTPGNGDIPNDVITGLTGLSGVKECLWVLYRCVGLNADGCCTDCWLPRKLNGDLSNCPGWLNNPNFSEELNAEVGSEKGLQQKQCCCFKL